MRLQISWPCVLFASLLTGCSANGTATGPVAPADAAATHFQAPHSLFIPRWSANASVLPPALRLTGPLRPHGRGGRMNPKFMSAAGGLYVSEFYSTDIFAYQHKNGGNNPPTCSIPNVLFPNDIAADDRGDVIDPDGGSKTIMVFKGDGGCGSLIGTINDPYGQPIDASSQNAKTGTIAVANIFSTFQGGGTISLCTLAGGCKTNLTNPNMYEVVGVAMSRNGADCWATSYDQAGKTWLTWFKGCSGPGQTATGWTHNSAGGLDIDKDGNLISFDPMVRGVSVYSGCTPNCTQVGPLSFALHGRAVYGHLNRQSMTLAAADYELGQIDIYDYKPPSKIKYMFSFDNGLTASDQVLGVAYAPRSHQ